MSIRSFHTNQSQYGPTYTDALQKTKAHDQVFRALRRLPSIFESVFLAELTTEMESLYFCWVISISFIILNFKVTYSLESYDYKNSLNGINLRVSSFEVCFNMYLSNHLLN